MKNNKNINKKKGLCKIIISFIIIIGMVGLFSGCDSSTASASSNNLSNATSTNNTTEKTSSNVAANTTDNSHTNSVQANTNTSNVDNKQSQAPAQPQSTPVSETKPAAPQQQPQTQPAQSPSVSNEDNTIVYYVPGSKVYHLSKSDTTLRRSKNIQSMTLKEAKANGMHQSESKADQ